VSTITKPVRGSAFAGPPPEPLRRANARKRIGAIRVSSESMLLALALFWAAVANGPFFSAALAGGADWGFAAALFVALAALNFLLLGLIAHRRWLKPLLALLIAATALAGHYMRHYQVVLDPTMLRNVLHTNWHEAHEMIGPAMLPYLLLAAGLPLALLWNVQPTPRRWPRALAWRAGSLLLALAVLVASVLAVFQPLASLVRNHKEVRYLVTPGNLLWSLGAVAGIDTHAAVGPRKPIGLDAKPGPLMASRTRPLVVVLVVGETARAANWGLDGYARQTTPELAALPVIPFGDVTACGTNTEVSLPCMFAPVGRRDYDEATIRSSESLLHVLARAGVGVQWRDNQSGCKGVCTGLAHAVDEIRADELCGSGRCLDETLLGGLPAWLQQLKPGPQAPTRLVVLHPLGNHGPSYFRRYPPAFARFQPACHDDDLRRCSQAEIVNAYDNALLYTDHVLAGLVRTLQAQAGTVDSALVYVSDHGESLGENNLFLHGLPYAIAPDVQKKVPMLMWLSPGFGAAARIGEDCLRRRAAHPAAHDHLFHTLLTLLDVQTALHEDAWDLTSGCRTQ
jgi:lipid A ethanolaminephosphotransferase